MKRIKKRLLLAAAVFVVLAAVLVLSQYRSGAAQKQSIEQLVGKADRIVLDPDFYFAKDQAKPKITVSGRATVEDLFARIEFEPAFVHKHCMCIGEVAFRFRENERELLALTLHHGQSLRILDKNWARNANLQLTPASRAAVAEWLGIHGYTPQPTTASAPE